MTVARQPESEVSDAELVRKLEAGYKVLGPGEMSPGYRDMISQVVLIAGDLELAALPMNIGTFESAPSLECKLQVAIAIQDEMSHAVMQYRLLDDLGFDSQQLIFARDPMEFRSNSIISFPARDYVEFCVTRSLADRAGFETTLDLEENCSFAPYSRSLRKVNFEEQFHVKHGENEVRRLWRTGGPEIRERIQRAVDYMFPLAAEWFGASDAKKTRTDMLRYKIRGRSNDTMRQRWLDGAASFFSEVGVTIPAHFDEETQHWVLDFELPILYDLEGRSWTYQTVTWEEKVAQWRADKSFRATQYRDVILAEHWGGALWS